MLAASACSRTRSGPARSESSSRAVRWISRWSSVRPKSILLLRRDLEPRQAEHAQCEAADRPLVLERGQGHLPTVADAADDVGVGDPRLLDEQLVELRLARDLAQRANLNPILLHVHQEVGEALVLRRLGVAARHQN